MRRFAAAAPPRTANPPQTGVQARGGVESIIWADNPFGKVHRPLRGRLMV